MNLQEKWLITFCVPLTEDIDGSAESIVTKLKSMNMDDVVIKDDATGLKLGYLSHENLSFKIDEQQRCIRVSCHCYLANAGKERLRDKIE